MKVSDIAGGPPKILIYGDPGTGKTALALTLGARAQVFDLDRGLLTGVKLEDVFQKDRLAVDVKQFLEPEPHKRATAFSACKAAVLDVANQCTAKKYPFDALIVDSLTALAENAISQVMYNSGRLGTAPELQHWGLAFSEVKQVIAVLQSLPIVVVMIAHEQLYSVGTGTSKEDKIELAVTGKNLPSQIARAFDELWRMKVRPAGGGKFKYLLQTLADDVAPARSRCNLPNMYDTSCGLWDIIKKMGYEPPSRGATA